MDLGGPWQVAESNEERRRGVTAPDDASDDGWHEASVPGHWRSVPALAASDGPVLYRRWFEAPPTRAGNQGLLTFDGSFYQADVWLDGEYLQGHRGLLPSRTASGKRPSGWPAPLPTPPGSRGELHEDGRRGQDRAAQPHRRVPALGLPGPRLESGAASGPPVHLRPVSGPVRIEGLQGAVPRGQRGTGRSRAGGGARPRPHRGAVGGGMRDRRGASGTAPSGREGQGPPSGGNRRSRLWAQTRSAGRSPSSDPLCGGHDRWADNRSTGST